MKEYYLDFKGNKRRLRIYHGDIVIVERLDEGYEGQCNLYKVIHETNDDWSLYCFVCGRPFFTGFEDKEDLKKTLLDAFDVRKVIAKHEIVDLLQQHVDLKIIKD
jgi:hypothetical protein